jgi:hypothetical protein
MGQDAFVCRMIQGHDNTFTIPENAAMIAHRESMVTASTPNTITTMAVPEMSRL